MLLAKVVPVRQPPCLQQCQCPTWLSRPGCQVTFEEQTFGEKRPSSKGSSHQETPESILVEWIQGSLELVLLKLPPDRSSSRHYLDARLRDLMFFPPGNSPVMRHPQFKNPLPMQLRVFT